MNSHAARPDVSAAPGKGRRPMPILTRVLAVLAVLALAAAVAAVLGWSGEPHNSGPQQITPPATANPLAADPCSWLAPADFAAVGVTTAPLVNYVPSVGLQPGEFECTGSGNVAVDLRWSQAASTAHIDINTWVGQLRAGKWSVKAATVPGAAEADYLYGALDAAGQPAARAEILLRVATLRIAVTLPPTTANAQAALTSLAALMVARITSLGVTKPPHPLPPPPASPSPSPSPSPGG